MKAKCIKTHRVKNIEKGYKCANKFEILEGTVGESFLEREKGRIKIEFQFGLPSIDKKDYMFRTFIPINSKKRRWEFFE